VIYHAAYGSVFGLKSHSSGNKLETVENKAAGLFRTSRFPNLFGIIFRLNVPMLVWAAASTQQPEIRRHPPFAD
jgi:hypothetical protein